MSQPDTVSSLRRFEIQGAVQFESGEGNLPKAKFFSRWSEGELYLHGAQVTRFDKHGDAPLLFLSRSARFVAGTAIRGGIPICFPWFGARAGAVSHGYARITSWKLLQTRVEKDGTVTLHLSLPAPPSWDTFEAASLNLELVVSAGPTLVLELIATNRSLGEAIAFEECLHTYLRVQDVGQISLAGLESAEYVDHTHHNQAFQASVGPMQIQTQTDQTFLNHSGRVELRDPGLGRLIRIHKQGSSSTVVWNPWTTQALSDLGRDEYRQFVCVESGNIGANRRTLAPGASSSLRVEFETERL